MNWSRKLKTWQKWGISFGASHIIIYVFACVLVVYSCRVIGNCEGTLLLDLLEYPFYLLSLKILNLSGYEHFYSVIVMAFYPIIGTVAWSLIGCILGLFWEQSRD